MAWYLIQGAYSPEAWASQIKNPQDRISSVSKMLEPLGIKFDRSFYAFGEYDLVIIAEGPGNVEMAGAMLAVAAGGALKSFKTTPLMSIEEGIEAMRKASDTSYRPPSA